MAVKDPTQIGNVGQFFGLRTDAPASKCPANYSPDCSDMIFSVGGTATRNPFKKVLSLPAQIVWRKEFTCKDGSVQVLALDINGVLYLVAPGGTTTILDRVAPGSTVSSVTAYGKEWMSFLNAQGGSDAPRQWDGKNLYRVSQGGPGAPPTVSNLTIPASSVASGSRVANEVTIVTVTPHSLLKGYLATLSNIDSFIQNITSLVIDNETLPNVATVTTPSPHGFVPGNEVAINNIQPITVGGSITAWSRADNVVTATTATNHGLVAGTSVLVELNSDGFGPVIVLSVPSLNTFTYSNSGGNGTGTAGSVQLPWPLDSGTLFTVAAVPTPSTFQFSISFVDGTWTTGSIGFDWDGAFYVEAVLSPTSFKYRQVGPNATITSGMGLVTPTGQIPAGDHLVCQHFLTKTGYLTAPSPYVRFTASGGQYVKVDNLAIGPANTQARVLSFTGANGSTFFVLLIPGQVNGLQISTSTVINDNTSTSAVLDFSDLTLLSASGINIPGNNLFDQVALNLPRGVRWYEDRLYWIGEKNTVVGFLNLDMAGGTLTGSTAPLGWTLTGTAGIVQEGFMPVLAGTGTISQPAATTLTGTAIIQPLLNYSIRAWLTVGSIVATLSSASTGFTSTATLAAGPGYVTANFSAPMPSAIPEDLVLTLVLTGATLRDVQLIFADNPNRNPIARGSYVQNPEAYDALTGNIGPNDDNSELRAIFVLQESLYFITENRLYSVQQIGNSEPSSWDPTQISDKCGAFHAESVVTGKGWAAWAGSDGAFWFGGGIPDKVSATITPTWRGVTNVTNVYDDSDAERVYFGTVGALNSRSMLVYDYHEVGLGGAGKWCPWNRPSNWISDSAQGTTFVFGSNFYQLSTAVGTDDDDLGSIAGYYTFAPFGVTALKKTFDYQGFRIAGTGVLTPFLYSATLTNLTKALNGQELSTLDDTVAEWPQNTNGRLLFIKLGQAGVQYELEDVTVIYQIDPNAPISGNR